MKIKLLLVLLLVGKMHAISKQLKQDLRDSKIILKILIKKPHKFNKDKTAQRLEINRITDLLKRISEIAEEEDLFDRKAQDRLILKTDKFAKALIAIYPVATDIQDEAHALLQIYKNVSKKRA
jgi:hypothetical protein